MSTNWVLDLFNIVQEDGGNILTEDELYICLQEFNGTEWEVDAATGNG
jgi:hypothetical protein